MSFGFSTPSDIEPKLSIHQLGQIHIKNQYDDIIGPLKIPELSMLRGEHIATVCADNFDALPYYNKTLVDKTTELDHVIPTDVGIHSGKLAFYLNGKEPIFNEGYCRLKVKLNKTTLSNSLFLSINPISQEEIMYSIKPGVTVISGWDPTSKSSGRKEYIYIRGE